MQTFLLLVLGRWRRRLESHERSINVTAARMIEKQVVIVNFQGRFVIDGVDWIVILRVIQRCGLVVMVTVTTVVVPQLFLGLCQAPVRRDPLLGGVSAAPAGRAIWSAVSVQMLLGAAVRSVVLVRPRPLGLVLQGLMRVPKVTSLVIFPATAVNEPLLRGLPDELPLPLQSLLRGRLGRAPPAPPHRASLLNASLISRLVALILRSLAVRPGPISRGHGNRRRDFVDPDHAAAPTVAARHILVDVDAQFLVAAVFGASLLGVMLLLLLLMVDSFSTALATLDGLMGRMRR